MVMSLISQPLVRWVRRTARIDRRGAGYFPRRKGRDGLPSRREPRDRAASRYDRLRGDGELPRLAVAPGDVAPSGGPRADPAGQRHRFRVPVDELGEVDDAAWRRAAVP